MILVMTDHPCLRVGRHSWYQSHYGYNTSSMVLFLKTTTRIHLDGHIRAIYIWQSFSFGEEHIGPTYVMIFHMHMPG
jgi:hypothetical protein